MLHQLHPDRSLDGSLGGIDASVTSIHAYWPPALPLRYTPARDLLASGVLP